MPHEKALQPPRDPLSIAVGGPSSQPYKSIDKLSWDAIPPFAILTGPNGSGKTQFLELLAYKLTGTNHPEVDMTSVAVEVTGEELGPDSVAYIPSHWDFSGTPSLDLANMQQAKQRLREELNERNTSGDFVRRRRRAILERFFGVKRLEEIDSATFVAKLPDDFAFMLDERDVTAGLVHVFLAYRLRFMEALERRTPEPAIRESLGPAPWDVLNEIFSAAESPFRVVSPARTKVLDRFRLELEDTEAKRTLRPADLSSGERTLLGLVLWLYNSQHHGRFPKLFLLDEPDAHLHPSMTRQFINVLCDVLVARYGVRVILTTHSPSTVALAPDGSVFEMRKTVPRIVKSSSRENAIGLLTSGLVIVSPGTRFVLVEDEDDVQFYSTLRDVLSDYGPTMDPRAIKPSPSLTFLPVGTGKGKDKTGGGRDAVLSWIEKLDAPPLAELFRGVIDRDLANLESPRVAVLRRYSIENYLLDPLVIYGVLSDEGSAPAIDGVAIAQGQEHLIRGLPPASLQAIVDTIGGAIGQKLGLSTQSDTMPLPVSFTNGVALTYPAWMINRRGHDLLPLSQATFGGPGVLSPPRLLRSFRRVRMIPTELADLLHGLQSQLAVTVPKKPVDESEHGEASGMQRPGNGSTGSSTTQTANS